MTESAIRYGIQSATPLIFPLLTAIGAAFRARQVRRAGGAVLETLIRWWLGGAVFLGAATVGVSFLLIPDYMAGSIGFPNGKPFQFEIAWANLGFALMGLLCITFRPGARLVTGLGYATFLWGATYGHIDQYMVGGDHEAGNTGGILVYDVAIPLVLIVPVLIQERRARR